MTSKKYAFFSIAILFLVIGIACGGGSGENEAEFPQTVVIDPVPEETVEPYKLQSYPEGDAVLYIDFDGELITNSQYNATNNGEDINAATSGISDDQIVYIWKSVSEDYRPFNINVTTDHDVFDAIDEKHSIQILVTPSDSWQTQTLGGLCTVSFTSKEPCWVWNHNLNRVSQAIADTISHETGHAMGLLHDGSSTEEYYQGAGDWAPIMGYSHAKKLSQWSKGEYPGSNNRIQNDVEIIASVKNGFGFRPDTQGDDTFRSATLIYDAGGEVLAIDNYGVIHNAADVDYFNFRTDGGVVSFNVVPSDINPNLNLKIAIHDSSNSILYSVDPQGIDHLDASISETLAAGEYYLVVDGTGEGEVNSGGYSDYGSLGYFEISGSIANSLVANLSPEIEVLSPSLNEELFIELGDAIQFEIMASDEDGSIESLVVQIESKSIVARQDDNAYVADWVPSQFGNYTAKVETTDNQGRISISTTQFRISQVGLRLLDQSTITIESVTTEEVNDNENFIATNMLDGDVNTYWSSERYDLVLPPHEVVFDLGSNINIEGFYMQDDGVSIAWKIKDLEYYVTDDLNSWGEPVLIATLESGITLNKLFLSSPVNGRYIKLKIIENHGNSSSSELSEFNVYVK